VDCDPPYQPLSTTSNFMCYSRHGFGETSNCGYAMSSRGWHSVRSGRCRQIFTHDLYRDFRCITITAERNINVRAERCGKITELRVLNWDVKLSINAHIHTLS
jgi:DNA adenine methylase